MIWIAKTLLRILATVIWFFTVRLGCLIIVIIIGEVSFIEDSADILGKIWKQ